MELVSHTTTTVITDQRLFKSTAPTGDVYYTAVTPECQETNAATPIARGPARRHLTTTIRTTLRRQVHRVAPYPGARPVRISSCSNTTTVAHERVVNLEDE